MKFRKTFRSGLKLLLVGLAALAVFAFVKADREAKEGVGLAFLGAGAFASTGMVNVRTLRDANLSVSVALPAANANVTSAAIDTANVNPGRVPCYDMLIELPATPSLTNGDTITLQFYHSADNVTWVAMDQVPSIVVTGGGGGGAAVGQLINGATINGQFAVPIDARRYLAVYAAVQNGGGNNTAISATLSLLF